MKIEKNTRKMEDFDVFTEEIEFTKPQYDNILKKYLTEVPSTPNGPNYQNSRKLQAEEYISRGNDTECAFHLSEAVSASLRTLAVYRDEQLKAADIKHHKIVSYIKPVQDIIDTHPLSDKDARLLDFITMTEGLVNKLKQYRTNDEVPFHKKYLRFGAHNNVDNFQRILKELPKEWTIIQLTAPYNPNENIKPLDEYRTEIDSVYVSVFTNEYLDKMQHGPITVNVPANVTKGEEKPLFMELYSLLEDNYKTIDNAQLYNNKKLLQNYWSRREDIDLRMKSVIKVMDSEWLGAWASLFTGRLVDASWSERIMETVDDTITNYGLKKLTQKQRCLLYKLVENCHYFTSTQIKSCLRQILTEHCNINELRNLINETCGNKCKTCGNKCETCGNNCETCGNKCETCGIKCETCGNKCETCGNNCETCGEDCKTSGNHGNKNGKECKTYGKDCKCGSNCKTCTKDFQFATELCVKCLSNSFEKLHKVSLIDGIRALSQVVKMAKDQWFCLKKAKRYPVVLIVDEMLDTFPWECLPVIYNHPVSRIESIHFLYYLYKIHERSIQDGYFQAKADVGRYLINPEKNLDRMEKRMESFVKYWCKEWTGYISEPPPPNEFVTQLKEADIFLYCGHGDGCRFANGAANGAGVEGAVGTRAVAILSGCGSVRLVKPPGRAAATSAHQHLHIAGSPVVVGMLWEVTDLEVDKVVSTLVALYVPSSVPTPWPSVGKAKWSQGRLETDAEQKNQFVPERNLLRAICRARASTNFNMIACSVVARGLPVRIVNDYD